MLQISRSVAIEARYIVAVFRRDDESLELQMLTHEMYTVAPEFEKDFLHALGLAL